MKYDRIRTGFFESRPNRFIAQVRMDGKIEVCHVKNTGRCKELLISGCKVYLQEADHGNRKTKYDLIAVEQSDGRIVNMDSQVTNKVVEEWIRQGNLFSENAKVQREKTYGGSRFDLYVEDGDRKAFIEVKGVTLDEGKIARFPDAPTERGLKHMRELERCLEEGYEAYLIFVIQMKGIEKMQANWIRQPEFGECMAKIASAGVHVLAYDCCVKSDEIILDQRIPIDFEKYEE